MNLIDDAKAHLERADRGHGRRNTAGRLFDHGQARLLTEMENARQARIANLLTLAGLGIEGSDAAATEAAALLSGSESAAEARIRSFCEEVQVAAGDYHARITAGQIVNLLAGRDANDDGALLASSAPATRPIGLPRLAG